MIGSGGADTEAMAHPAIRASYIVSCLAIGGLALAACGGSNRVDSTETSYTIASKLTPSKAHPFTGLWRDDCGDAFGLAIQPAGPGVYSISFCGPGGCFEPGTYRPNSPIAGDPHYRILDNDTIAVSTRKGFQAYHRCVIAARQAGRADGRTARRN
jgi:hypothetical protein